MLEPMIDARIGYYRPDVNPYAVTKRKTVLEGVKLGGVGNEVRIGQTIRGWVVPNGEYPDGHPLAQDVLGFNLEIRAHVYGHGQEPELILEDMEKSQTLAVPQKAFQRGHYKFFEFGTAIKPQELKFGQVVEGLTLGGDRTTFVVSTPDPDTKLPRLETLTEPPQRVPITTKDDKNLLLAGPYRLLGETVRDFADIVDGSFSSSRLETQPS